MSESNSKKHKVLFWSILVLFVALFAWWSTFYPYSRRTIYRVIPTNAMLVTEHEELAARWQDVAKNSVIRRAFDAGGVDGATLDEILVDPGVDALFKLLGQRKTVFAYVPSLGGTGRPTWIVSSWMGSSSQLMRFGIFPGKLLDMERIRLPDRRWAWIWRSGLFEGLDGTSPAAGKSTGQELFLTVTAFEGVLLGCLTADPNDLQYLVNRLAQGWDMLPELDLRLRTDRENKTSAKDSIWATSWEFRTKFGEPLQVMTEVSLVGDTGLDGLVDGNIVLPPARKLRYEADLSSLARLAGNTPDGIIIVPRSYVQELVRDGGLPREYTSVMESLDPHLVSGSPLVAFMMGGNYSGRILRDQTLGMGIRVPALVVAVMLKNADNGLSVARTVLDKINSKHKQVLIPRALDKSGGRVLVVDSAQSGFYGELRPDEKLAVAVKGEWLLLSSNAGSLLKFINRSAGEESRPKWWRSDAGECPAYAWFDLDATGKTLGSALTVYSMMVMGQGSEGESIGAMIRDIRKWVEAARSLDVGSFSLDSGGTGGQLRFVLGSPVADPSRTKMP